MESGRLPQEKRQTVFGVCLGSASFLIWGLSPIYWKMLSEVPIFEVVIHRVVWSFIFLLLLIFIQGRWKELIAAMKNWRTLLILVFTALTVSCNWLVYIWAINNDHVLQASLGYYINPLVNVLLGLVFLKEKLRRLQTVAVVLAGIGVLYLTVYYGEFPWVSLVLAFSFGFYGLIRKVVPVSSLTGLAIETLLLTIPAVVYLYLLDRSGKGVFLHTGFWTDFFLVGSFLVTAVPLLLFTLSARRLTLSTVGFMQYLAPTCMMLLGVFLYHEPFSSSQAVTFVLIWLALLVYSFDSVTSYGK